jgi:hypothetical protein
MISLSIVGEKHHDAKGDFYLEEKLLPLPVRMKERHHVAMLNFYKVVNYLIQHKRDLPVMLSELKTSFKGSGLTKPIMKDLEAFGYLKIVTAPLRTKGDNSNLGNRVFVYWTAQGRAYIKEYIRDGQARSDTGTGEHSEGIQPNVQAVDGENRMHGELPVEVRPGGTTEVHGDTDNRSDSVQEASTQI